MSRGPIDDQLNANSHVSADEIWSQMAPVAEAKCKRFEKTARNGEPDYSEMAV